MNTLAHVYLTHRSCGQLARALRAKLFKLAPHPIWEEAIAVLKLIELEDLVLNLAAAARGLAQSWRNFDVGTVIISLRLDCRLGENPWAVRFFANDKEENSDKICGEIKGMNHAFDSRLLIVGFFVVGEPQHDHGSGKKSETLTSCEKCRFWMRGGMVPSVGIVRAETLAVSANCHDLEVREHHTVESLHDFHEEDLYQAGRAF